MKIAYFWMITAALICSFLLGFPFLKILNEKISWMWIINPLKWTSILRVIIIVKNSVTNVKSFGLPFSSVIGIVRVVIFMCGPNSSVAKNIDLSDIIKLNLQLFREKSSAKIIFNTYLWISFDASFVPATAFPLVGLDKKHFH